MRGRPFYIMGIITLVIISYAYYTMIPAWDKLPEELRLFIGLNVILWIFIGFTQIAVGWLLDRDHKRGKT